MLGLDKVREMVFSFSSLSCWSRCPRKWFYRYVVGKKESSPFFVYGRAVHFGQEADNWAKLEGRRLPVKAVLDAAVDKLKEESAKDGIKPEVDRFTAEHERQLEAFEASGERDKIRPIKGSIEAPFEMTVQVGDPETGTKEGEAKLQGFVDVVSEDPAAGTKTVVDYKTSPKPVYPAAADANLQFGLYLLGAQANAVQAVSFVKSGKQRATTKVTRPSVMTESRRTKLLNWLADTIRGIRRSLKTGDYPKCSPECHWCSREACSFYNLCYQDNDPDLPKLIQIEDLRPVGTVERPEWRK